MPKINSVRGLEILDSRGRPTVKAFLEMQGGINTSASVPSGASTGSSEAHELRDEDHRYGGMGCQKAVSNINQIISQSVVGVEFINQEDFDGHLKNLDGTSELSNLGANAILAVSLAFSRGLAKSKQEPLYRHYSSMAKNELSFISRPTINLFSGGKHAGAQVPIQDLLIVPVQNTISEILACAFDIYQSAVNHCHHKYQMRWLTADEGGLAPPFRSTEDMFEDALLAIEKAGYKPGEQVFLATDIASTQFYHDKSYQLGDQQLSADQMIDLLSQWCSKYPIISIEDGLDEEAWDQWPVLVEKLGNNCQVMGDDFLCTNPERITRAINVRAATALLLKVNQIGSLTDALSALKIAQNAGWKVTVSARSGETEDHWLSDLAMGWQGNYIKVGSITQSERLAKYNRLLEIEQETGLPVYHQ